MKKNDYLKIDDTIYRILAVDKDNYLVLKQKKLKKKSKLTYLTNFLINIKGDKDVFKDKLIAFFKGTRWKE